MATLNQAPRRGRAGSAPGGGRRPLVIVLVAALVLAVVAAAGVLVLRKVRGLPPIEAIPTDVQVAPRAWPSGIWVGGTWGVDRVDRFGAWRGSPADFVVTYPAYATWAELAESDWHVQVFNGFAGRLVYGLPLLPKDEAGKAGALAAVAAGQHDDVFNSVADVLLKHGRGDSVVRIGLEAQGAWFPWGAGNGANTPEDFKAAFAHVSRLLQARMPKAEMMFDISCGAELRGQKDRMDPLTALYPGDDVVDIVGCDHYDHYTVISHTSKQFRQALTPKKAAGLQDTLDFARAHGKKFGVPEWGLTAEAAHGGGDNTYFMHAMYMWFSANAKDIAFENYFSEPEGGDLGSAIWEPSQNPAAAAVYRRLWGTTSPSAAASPSG